MASKTSKKSVRQSKIVDVLELNPAMRVNQLADKLNVSSETVRRDLAELDDSGRIKRTYGGAVRTTAFEPALMERLKLHVEERERIARQAVERLGDAHTIFIGGGATALHFARALRLIDRRLTVLTASLRVAMEVSTNALIEVMVLPGIVEPKEGLVHGAETLQSISRFRTPIAIVGASALDETGVSDALLSAAQVYSAMIANADHTFVLADSSKFGQRSLQLIMEWSASTTLICNEYPEDGLREQLEAQGVDIVVVG